MASPPAWSMGTSKRNFDLTPHEVPGPGAYNSTLNTKKSNPSWRVGTASRSTERKVEVPGPGTYNSPGKISTNAPRYGFSAKTAVDFKDFTPGPGAYDAAGSRGFDVKAPSYSFRIKSAHPGQNRVTAPGPGAYDQTSKVGNQKAPSYRIGSSKRDDIVRSGSTPGPGTYQTRPSTAADGPRYGFGSSERDASTGNGRTAPGPGAYTYKGSFDQGGKGHSLVPRRPDSAIFGASRSPGPGAYNPSASVKAAPAYRIGSAVRDTRDTKERASTPGPGNYNISYIKGNQNVRIGTSTRKAIYEERNTPGPGAYTHGSKVGEGPKFIMNPRRDDSSLIVNKFVPGPGAYNVKVDATKLSNSAVGIGTSNRVEINPTKANPGPGQYDTRGRLGGPKYGFGTGIRDQEVKNNVPGPGQYKLPHTVGDVAKYAFGSSPLKIHL